MRRERGVGLAAVTALLTLFCALAAPSAAQEQEFPEGPAAQIVVLADESGSMTDEAIAQEKQAVALLAVSELSERSEMAVLGYGSSNASGQNAFTQYCGFMPLDTAASREKAAACGTGIHKRESPEGDDTDYVAALDAALELFREVDPTDDRSRIIILLTDGALDVRNSPQYGVDETARQAEAARLLDEQLTTANMRGIQIWPVGFSNQNRTELERYALTAATGTTMCGFGNVPKPAQVFSGVINYVADVAVSQLARASCASTTDPVAGMIPAGGTQTLDVAIPPIASESVISVVTGNSRVEVTYMNPDGKEVKGSSAGQAGWVEGAPGTWKVTFKASPSVGPVTVSARSYWRAVVRPMVEAFPSLTEDNAVEVRVGLSTASGKVTDLSAVPGVEITATVEGEGFDEMPVSLAAVGAETLGGQFVLPAEATGEVRVVARVAGPVIVSDELPKVIRLTQFLAVLINLPQPPQAKVMPGQSVQGTIDFANLRDPVSATLEVTGAPEGVRVEPETVTFRRGRGTEQFEIVFDPDTSVGQVKGTIEVKTEDGRLITSSEFTTTVVMPPTSGIPLVHSITALASLLVALASLLVALLVVWSKISMNNVLFILHSGEEKGTELDFKRVESRLTKDRRWKVPLWVVGREAGDPKFLERIPSEGGSEGTDVLTVTRLGCRFKIKRPPGKSSSSIRSHETVEVGGLLVEIRAPKSRPPGQHKVR